MKKLKAEVKIRSIQDSDMNFIFSTWLKGLYHGCSLFKEIPSPLFFSNYQKVLEKLIHKKCIQSKIACLPDEEDVILGYSIYESDCLHWIFVKSSWRFMGIGRKLLPKEIKVCSHLTSVGKSLKKKEGIIFNPFV